MERTSIEIGDFVHVYNRGVDKREIFLDAEDRARFFFYLGVLNHDKTKQTRAAKIFSGLEDKQKTADFSLSLTSLSAELNKNWPYQKPITDLCAFVLMGNHYHLLLHQRIIGGISRFIQRLSTAYTMYFNQKYERSGVLFESCYRSKIITGENYLNFLFDYIHLNPVTQRKGGVLSLRLSAQEAEKFLDKYFWSSYPAYAFNSEHAPFLNSGVFEEFIGQKEDYKRRLFREMMKLEGEDIFKGYM